MRRLQNKKRIYKEEDPHWQEDSICLYADLFDELELYPLFQKAVPQFDYYGTTEVSRKQWQALYQFARLGVSCFLTGIQSSQNSPLSPFS